jgi:hypothetical protein
MEDPTKTCRKCKGKPTCIQVCKAEIIRRAGVVRYYQKVKPLKVAAVTVSGVCCICARDFIRTKRTGDPKTCGETACVRKHKANLKLEWNRRAHKSGYYKAWNAKQEAKKPKTPCSVCGIPIHVGRTMCGKCYGMMTRKWPSCRFEYCRVCGRSKPSHRRCFNPDCSVALYKHRVKRKLNRKQHDPIWQMRVRISQQVRSAIRRGHLWGRKTLATFEMLRYQPSDLVSYLQSRFEFGMTWANYGSEWEVDHVVPVSWFRGKKLTPATVRKVWSLTNLRPRWKDNATAAKYGSFMEGNREKGARFAG